MKELHILLLEDSEDDADFILYALRRDGYSPIVTRVETEQDFRDSLHQPGFELIIADYSLPQFDGRRALDIYLAQQMDIPFIIVSGTIGEDVAVEILKAGAHNYVLKDKLSDLVPVIERELRDATNRRERTQAHVLLREHEHFLTNILDSIQSGFSVVDTNMIITRVNPALERLYAHHMPLVGKQCFRAYHGADQPCADCPSLQVLHTGKAASGIVPQQNAVGDIIGWQRLSCYPLFDSHTGMVTGVIEDVSDITEQVLASESLKRSRDFYLTLFEAFPTMIMRSNADAVADYFNATWLTFRGRSLEEECGGGWRDGVHPDDLGPGLSAAHQAFHARKSVKVEFRMRRHDGEYRLLSTIGRPFNNIDGQFAGYIASCSDITDYRNAEEQLQQVMKLEAIGQLASGVAHDFNNILTGIGGLAQLMQSEVLAGSTQQEDLSEMVALVNRGAKLTHDLLAFSRRQPQQRTVFSVRYLLRDTVKLLDRLIGDNITIVCNPGSENLKIEADRDQLEQVLMNMAINARDAMPRGGTLTITAAAVMLTPPFVKKHPGTVPGPQIRLTVTDTGCGMNAELQQHIFEPFFTTKEVGKGTGLGLASAYGIVQQHGGHLVVTSVPEHGTTFAIYLPRTDVAQPASADGAIEPPSTTPRYCILLVEDEKSVRKVTQRILEHEGHRVLSASSPVEARALFSQYGAQVDVVLTDINMPGASGLDLADELLQTYPCLGVVYMSGNSEAMVERMNPKHFPFVVKPFSTNVLLTALHTAFLHARNNHDEKTMAR